MIRPSIALSAFFALACGSSTSALPDAAVTSDASVAQDTGASIIGPSGTPQSLHDVSVLWPLPSAGNLGLLLGPASTGKNGELLPATIFAKLPMLTPQSPPRDVFRVVAARIDPCFKFAGSSECSNQLRLVMQPVVVSSDGVTTYDGAIHLFYSLSREQLAALASAIAGHGSEPSRALGVHPTLATEGLSGTFATRLRALVLEYAGASNLVRVTCMLRTNSRQGQWEFLGYEVAANATTEIAIPTMGVNKQSVTMAGFLISGSATPELKATDNPSLFYNDADVTVASESKVQAAYDGVLRTLNPERHTPETIDCVSCHTATSARYVAEKLRGINAQNNANAYRPALLAVPTDNAKRTDILRAFGYFDAQPVVSERVANESDAVVAYLRREVFKVSQ